MEEIYKNLIEKEYYHDKRLLCVKYFNSNQLLVKKIGYYNNGNLCYYYNYKNGKQHGEQKDYYRNGNLCYYDNYKNGIRHGDQKNYRDNGKLWAHHIRFKSNIEGIFICNS